MSLIAFSLAIGYLIGSIPTAYFIVRSRSNVDIRQAGSGNVGAVNTYKVTRSKLLGVLVALLDICKGVAAITVAKFIVGTEFILWGSAGLAAVLGHNFSVWMRLKGGRGLAAACGVTLTWAWIFPLVWAVLWVPVRIVNRNTHISNSVGILGVLAVVLFMPEETLVKLTGEAASAREVMWFGIILCALILIKHIQPVSDYFRKENK